MDSLSHNLIPLNQSLTKYREVMSGRPKKNTVIFITFIISMLKNELFNSLVKKDYTHSATVTIEQQ